MSQKLQKINDPWGEARSLIKKHEGLRLLPYKDSLGYITIGYGRCLDKNPLTTEEAEYLFDNDFACALKECQDSFKFFEKLNSARKVVLIDMCFNLGITKLNGFRNTLKLIELEQYDAAADNMLESLWAKQVKGRAVLLAKIMRTGEFLRV